MGELVSVVVSRFRLREEKRNKSRKAEFKQKSGIKAEKQNLSRKAE